MSPVAPWRRLRELMRRRKGRYEEQANLREAMAASDRFDLWGNTMLRRMQHVVDDTRPSGRGMRLTASSREELARLQSLIPGAMATFGEVQKARKAVREALRARDAGERGGDRAASSAIGEYLVVLRDANGRIEEFLALFDKVFGPEIGTDA